MRCSLGCVRGGWVRPDGVTTVHTSPGARTSRSRGTPPYGQPPVGALLPERGRRALVVPLRTGTPPWLPFSRSEGVSPLWHPSVRAPPRGCPSPGARASRPRGTPPSGQPPVVTLLPERGRLALVAPPSVRATPRGCPDVGEQVPDGLSSCTLLLLTPDPYTSTTRSSTIAAKSSAR